MSSLSLNIISPSIRNRILSFKINENYDTGENPILYNSNTPLDELPKKEEYNKVLKEYFEYDPVLTHDLEYFSKIDKHAKFDIGDGYMREVHRDRYGNQWDQRKNARDERRPDIYFQTDQPSLALRDLWGQTGNSPYRARQGDGINGYIEYTNHILGKSTPTGIEGPTTNSSAGYNILAAIVRGDGVGLALNPNDHGIRVVTDLDLKQTLGGRIYSQMSGQETPLGRFGLKAAAVSLANQMMAKTGQFVSGVVKESGRWIASNTIGRLFGGDGSDFDLNAFGSSRITNPPGIMDDILNATGLNRGLNAVAGGFGFDFLLDNNNWTQTATSLNDGKYVNIDSDLLADTLGSDQPDFDAFINPQGKAGRAFEDFEDGKEKKGFFKRLFSNKESKKRETVNEWEFRRLQQDMLVQWTGAMNAKMIHTLLNLNKYSPGYTDKNSKRANRRGVPLEKKGYDSLFPNNKYINTDPLKGLPTVAEYKQNEVDEASISNIRNIVYKYNTITWGEPNVSIDIEEDEERGFFERLRYNRQQRQINRTTRRTERHDSKQPIRDKKAESKETGNKYSLKERWQDRREARRLRNEESPPETLKGDFFDTRYNTVKLIKNLNETNTLLGKTSALFAANKIGTMVSRFHKVESPSFIQSAVHPKHGMSKGRMLANKHFVKEKMITKGGYTDPWCRVWTAEVQHRTLLNAIRPFVNPETDKNDPGNIGKIMTMKELHGRIGFIRPYLDEFAEFTSLQNNGLPKIAPYREDFDKYEYNDKNRYKYNRKYMFSIENLAWKGLELERLLCPSQIGPNGGRIYWFSPLNLTFNEISNNNIQEVSVIGRGEPMYSFRGNTSRTGDLSFSMIVDHSSFHEYMEGRKDEKNQNMGEEEFYQSVLRFDAGCDIPQVITPKNKDCIRIITGEDKKEVIGLTDILVDDKIETVKSEEINLVTVYYPNDFSGVNWHNFSEQGEVKIRVLESMKYNNHGHHIMSYLYAGGGSDATGKKPHKTGIDSDSMNFGYEMKNDFGTKNISISDNQLNKVTNEGYTMMSFSKNKRIDGISKRQQTKPNTYKTETDFISDFNLNMHVTDQIVPYYEKTYNSNSKLIPRERNEVLPRTRYTHFMSNWDIANFELNSKKRDPDKFSFGSFYELCTDKTDGRHKDQLIEGYETKEELIELFNSAERIEVLGNASKDGTTRDNKLLGKYRAISLALFIIEKLPGIKLHDEPDNNYIAPKWIIKDEVLKEESDNELGYPSIEESKYFRHAHVRIFKKVSSIEEVQKKVGDEETSVKNNITQHSFYNLTAKNTRYDEEMDFYKYVKKNDDLTWTKIRDRYNKYIPALWSCTPEGFNARLTFLQQCLRSGPPNVAGENVRGVVNIANLAFGRPPVCILRIGDFIQSKVFIENVNFDYKCESGGIQWDLNPEGIGIQPMQVKVTIKLKFMGGQDITGAIARLQNAVSFNYYANTSVYDDRSDGNKPNGETGDIEIDMTRQRGMVYSGGFRDTFTSENKDVTKIINGERISTKRDYSTNILYMDEIKENDGELKKMNEGISGLFDPYTYYNGNMYLDKKICPKDDSVEYIIPFGVIEE